MAEEKRAGAQPGRESDASRAGREDQTGDPGRTPGTAEGDRETVEEDLKDSNEKK